MEVSLEISPSQAISCPQRCPRLRITSTFVPSWRQCQSTNRVGQSRSPRPAIGDHISTGRFTQGATQESGGGLLCTARHRSRQQDRFSSAQAASRQRRADGVRRYADHAAAFLRTSTLRRVGRQSKCIWLYQSVGSVTPPFDDLVDSRVSRRCTIE